MSSYFPSHPRCPLRSPQYKPHWQAQPTARPKAVDRLWSADHPAAGPHQRTPTCSAPCALSSQEAASPVSLAAWCSAADCSKAYWYWDPLSRSRGRTAGKERPHGHAVSDQLDPLGLSAKTQASTCATVTSCLTRTDIARQLQLCSRVAWHRAPYGYQASCSNPRSVAIASNTRNLTFLTHLNLKFLG